MAQEQQDRRGGGSGGGDRRGGGGGGKGGGGKGGGRGKKEEKEITYQERVIQIRRVSKVVKGGKKLSFRAIVVIGNEKGVDRCCRVIDGTLW